MPYDASLLDVSPESVDVTTAPAAPEPDPFPVLVEEYELLEREKRANQAELQQDAAIVAARLAAEAALTQLADLEAPYKEAVARASQRQAYLKARMIEAWPEPTQKTIPVGRVTVQRRESREILVEDHLALMDAWPSLEMACGAIADIKWDRKKLLAGLEAGLKLPVHVEQRTSIAISLKED